MSSICRRSLVALFTSTVAFFACAGTSTAGTLHVNICGSNARAPGDDLSWSANSPLVATADCPYSGPGLELYAPTNVAVGNGSTAGFQITAPPGVVINYIHVVNAYSRGIGSGGWWGAFYWNGGPGASGNSGALTDAQFNAGGCCSQTNLQSSTIGWFITCSAQSSCSSGDAGRERGMSELDLVAEEDGGPAITATGSNNLWYQSGWVRGTWPASISATDPSGVCTASVALGTLPPIETPAPDSAPDVHTFQQCPQQNFSAAFDTSASQGSLGQGEGTMQLQLLATNAAHVTSDPTQTVNVDNSTPTIALSGPTDAPTTAGTQYVTASAGGSPSGIADIVCNVDGGPAGSYPGATAQVPVSGIGDHTVSCFSQNNAVDPSGTPGSSPSAAWSLKIGEPTVLGISFNRLVGLRCRHARVRVEVPGHWVTVHRRGKLVKLRTRSHLRIERMMRCRPRTARRETEVFVRVRRHGHVVTVKRVKFVRVVVPPHVVARTSRVVPFGRGTTVDGWLGTSSNTALAGRTVQVLAAPDNGSNEFRPIATTTTALDGSWSARVPAGPSRIIEAVYGGDPTTEGTTSGQVRTVVRAKVKLLRVSPRRIPWGGTVRITGQLIGGYLPPGGALVRLRIGQGRSYQTYGVAEHVTGTGRFRAIYTFGAGDPAVSRTYWFELASLPMGNFPWAPGASNRRTVIVGG